MERREFPRLKARMPARLLINNDQSGRGMLFDLSAGGVGVLTELSVVPGDHVVIHLEGGARLEGTVMRLLADGFGVELTMSEAKRSRLIDALEPMVENVDEIVELPMNRRVAERVAGLRMKTECRTENGVLECRIVDMSLTGAAIETGADIEIGTPITIGQTRGTVVRRYGRTYGVRFDGPGEQPGIAAPDSNAPDTADMDDAFPATQRMR